MSPDCHLLAVPTLGKLAFLSPFLNLYNGITDTCWKFSCSPRQESLAQLVLDEPERPLLFLPLASRGSREPATQVPRGWVMSCLGEGWGILLAFLCQVPSSSAKKPRNWWRGWGGGTFPGEYPGGKDRTASLILEGKAVPDPKAGPPGPSLILWF